MAMMSQKELSEIVDFERLKKSNDLILKWGQRFKISKNKFVRWATALPRKLQEHKKLLAPNMRCAFVKDAKTMFYAIEVQGILVEQYEQMVHKILKSIYITQDMEIYDDMYNEGLIAIMYASWSFRNVKNKCAFTTFCFNTLYMRLRGIKNKNYRKEQRRGNKVQVYNECQQGEDFDLSNYAVAKEVWPEDLIENVDVVMEKLIVSAKLDEADAYLMKEYAKRKEKTEKGVWYQEFHKKFLHTFKTNRLTRQGLQQRVKKLKAKLLFYYKKLYNPEIQVA